MRVHAAGQRLLHVLVESIRRHRHDGDAGRIGPLDCADGPRRLEAVHDRHADIHEDCRIAAGLRLDKGLDGLHAVLGDINRAMDHLQQALRDFRIDLIVLDQKDTAAGEIIAPLHRRRFPMRLCLAVGLQHG